MKKLMIYTFAAIALVFALGAFQPAAARGHGGIFIGGGWGGYYGNPYYGYPYPPYYPYPAYYPPPAVVYAQPPVVYAQPPVVYSAPPPPQGSAPAE